MDGQRFDDLTRAMATGTSRRRLLRLGGGGLAGALLAATGLGHRARADGVAEFPGCVDYEQGGPAQISVQPGEQVVVRKPCGACHGDQYCGVLLNPAGQIVCRCIGP